MLSEKGIVGVMRLRLERSRLSSRRYALFGPGLLFVISGPSGAGKDSLVDAVRARLPRLRYSVSATTRTPRPGEVEGEAYFFLTPERFAEIEASGGFLETKRYNGHAYGTPRAFVEQALAEGEDLIMKPDVDGALAVRRNFPQATLLFLLPDKFSYLESRLSARRTETNEEIAARLAIAHEEIAQVRSFDYLIINQEARLDRAVDDVLAVFRAERFRIHRYDDSTLRRLEAHDDAQTHVR